MGACLSQIALCHEEIHPMRPRGLADGRGRGAENGDAKWSLLRFSIEIQRLP
jgi:hypothetical protein